MSEMASVGSNQDSELAENGIVVTEAMIEAGAEKLDELLVFHEKSGVGYMQLVSRSIVEDIILASFQVSE